MTSPIPNFVSKQTVVTADWLNAVNAVLNGSVPSQGTYNATFQFGPVQLAGPNQLQTAFGDLGFGLLLPSPSGGNIPGLLIGGAGKTAAQIITDQQIPGLAGLDLFISAGETTNGGVENGGRLWLFGGAAFGGTAGSLLLEGGTSVNGTAGDVQILGGNSTNGPAGNVYILAGTSGSFGGSVKIYATKLNNQSGDISFWLGQPDIPHSIPLFTMSHTGALFPGNSGAGNPGDVFVSGGNNQAPHWGQPGLVGSVSLSLSGATATIPQAAFNYASFAGMVLLNTNAGIQAVTTGPNDIILSTLPSFLWPSGTRKVPCMALLNGSAGGFFGVATISTAGGIQISLASPTNGGNSVGTIANGWSISPGTSKGVEAGWSIVYQL